MNTNSLTFKANGETDSSTWRYTLTITTDKKFKLDFYLRSWQGDSNWSDASVDEWEYNGTFSANMINESYDLVMSDIIKSGTSQANGDYSGPKPIEIEPYTKPMRANIKLDGSCIFTKDRYGVNMKGEENIHDFFNLIFPSLNSSSSAGTTNASELDKLEEEYRQMKKTPSSSGYEFCDICGRYDQDAGGIDYWVWKNQKWCYGGCWDKLLRKTKDDIELLKLNK